MRPKHRRLGSAGTNAVLPAALVLVSGPAGAGKTRGKMAIRRYVDVALVGLLAATGLAIGRMRPMEAGDLPAELATRPKRRGWWQVGKAVVASITEDRVMAEAASVTFYTLLALFPAIAALISLYGLVADPGSIESHLAALSGVVPEGGMQIITAQVHSLAAAGQKALGLGAVTGLLFSLWSANAGVKSIFDALNAVYEEKEKRSYVRLTITSLIFTLSMLLMAILSMGAVVVIPAVLKFIYLGDAADLLLWLARWPVMLLAIMLVLASLYRFGPSRTGATFRWISWGSAFSAIVWIGASAGFSYYVANFGSYNKTYGSLGAVIGFMTWIWISTIIVLVGAELDSELEKEALLF